MKDDDVQQKKPALLLLPNLIGESPHHEVFIPSSVDKAVLSLDGIISESERSARRFLGRFKTNKPAHLIPVAVFSKKTPDKDIDFFLEPIKEGERWGYVSDAGLPCIADPGAKLVFRARELGIVVQAFVGPSSITQALMLSGLSGQSFSFHGYLERDEKRMKEQIKEMAMKSKRDGSTHIFMQTPYNNQKTLEITLNTLDGDDTLCIAADLTLPSQMVMTRKVSAFRNMALPNIDKKNALFLVGRS